MNGLHEQINWKQNLSKILCLFSLLINSSHADFINGGFESSYTSDGTTCSPITGWTQQGYFFPGTGSSSPQSISQINLQNSGGSGIQYCGLSDIINGATQSITDYFLVGASPTPTPSLPLSLNQSAMINLRYVNTPKAKSGTSNSVTGWSNIANQCASLSQQITVGLSDIDALDGKVHIRFVAQPVLQNPAHAANQQPFTAFQLDNITTGRVGNNPLAFKWVYGGQAGVPWQSLTSAGTNQGSSSTYQYTNPQSYDISPGNAFISVGDVINLTVLACGCSLGGHEGHVWLDSVGTSIPQTLWVSATGPVSSSSGSNITYTYTYTNNTTSVANNVQVVANMPAQNATGALTTFVSSTNPTTGTGTPSCTGGTVGTTNPVTCSMGTLQPGQSGTFTITVNIPGGWAASSGPVNNGNYPISATSVSPLLGPLVQTQLLAPSSLSNLVANVTGMPNTGTLNQPYIGTFTCSNIPTSSATADATNATCEIANLPSGLSQGACTISPSSTSWTQPATIPSGETVTCTVNGTPTTTGTVTALATTDASNNSNSTDNIKEVPITISNSNNPAIPATLNGSAVLNPAVVCCGRPVILGDLPVSGTGSTIYTVTNRTGNVSCFIGHSGNQTYLKVNGNNGSCTIVGTKNGTTSAPLTIVAP